MNKKTKKVSLCISVAAEVPTDLLYNERVITRIREFVNSKTTAKKVKRLIKEFFEYYDYDSLTDVHVYDDMISHGELRDEAMSILEQDFVRSFLPPEFESVEVRELDMYEKNGPDFVDTLLARLLEEQYGEQVAKLLPQAERSQKAGLTVINDLLARAANLTRNQRNVFCNKLNEREYE